MSNSGGPAVASQPLAPHLAHLHQQQYRAAHQGQHPQRQQEPQLSPRHILAAQSYFGPALLPQQHRQHPQQLPSNNSTGGSVSSPAKMTSPSDFGAGHGLAMATGFQPSQEDFFLRSLLSNSASTSAAPSDLTTGSSSGDDNDSPPSSFNDFVLDASPLPSAGLSAATSPQNLGINSKASVPNMDNPGSFSLLLQHAQLQQQYLLQQQQQQLQQQQQQYNQLRSLSLSLGGLAGGPVSAPVPAAPISAVSFDPAMLLQHASVGALQTIPNLTSGILAGMNQPLAGPNAGQPTNDGSKVGGKRAKPSADSAVDGNQQESQKRARIERRPSVADSSDLFPHLKAGTNANAHALLESLRASAASKSVVVKKSPSSEDLAFGSLGSKVDSSERKEGDNAQISPLVKHQKKVAHNAIERRYRNNINDRIAALRNAVPALREYRIRQSLSPADAAHAAPASKKGRGKGKKKGKDDDDLVDGVSAATKLNKATVLGKATDYIKFLKTREIRLQVQVDALRQLIFSLEGGEELLEMWEMQMEPVLAARIEDAIRRIEKEEEDAFARDAAAAAAGIDGENDNNEDEADDQDGDEGNNSDDQKQTQTSAATQSAINTSQAFTSQAPLASMPFAMSGQQFANPFAPFPGHMAYTATPSGFTFVPGADGSAHGTSAGPCHSPTSDGGRRDGQNQFQAGRYLMAVFLGFSFLGSASRDHHAHHAATGSRPSSFELSHRLVMNSGSRVVGAGHELFKRAASLPASTSPIGANASLLAAHGTAIPHAHLPSHVLFFEVMRGLAFLACLLYFARPYFAIFTRTTRSRKARRSSSSADAGATDEAQEHFQRRKSLLATMAMSRPASGELDTALRTYVRAPQNFVSSLVSLGRLTVRTAVAEARARLRFRSRGLAISDADREAAAVWCRLLELETSLGQLTDAPGGLVSRLHTVLTVNFLPLERLSRLNAAAGLDLSSDVTSAVRVYATQAIALMRIANNELAPAVNSSNKISAPGLQTIVRLALASQVRKLARASWARARKAAWRARDVREESAATNAADGGVVADAVGAAGLWLEAVLRLELEDAEALCPSVDTVYAISFAAQDESAADLSTAENTANQQVTRALLLSPLPAIAAVLHQQELAKVWAEVFGSLVRGSCAHVVSSAASSSSVRRDSVATAGSDAGSKFELDVVSDPAKRASVTKRVLELVRTAPPAPLTGAGASAASYSNLVLADVLLATWALVCGNPGLARAVLRRLGASYATAHTSSSQTAAPVCASFASVLELDALLSPPCRFTGEEKGDADEDEELKQRNVILSTCASGSARPVDEVDALAASTLAWISYLRANARYRGSSGRRASVAGKDAMAQGLQRLGLDIRAYLALAHSDVFSIATSSTSGYDQDDATSSTSAATAAVVEPSIARSRLERPSRRSSEMTVVDGRVGDADAPETLTDTIILLQRAAGGAQAGVGVDRKRLSESSDSGVELEGW